ncbi:MAG: hypothetical protein U0Z44_18050 [Kouleothrix sp.]
MILLDGSLIFLTDGAGESLAALPGLARLAQATNNHLTIVHMIDPDDQRNDDDHWIAAAVGRLAPPRHWLCWHCWPAAWRAAGRAGAR